MVQEKTVEEHYVQRAYLQNFSVNGDFIYMLDKKSGKATRQPIKLKEVAKQPDFYNLPEDKDCIIEREFLKKYVEDKGMPVIDKIINEKSIDSLTQSQKKDLAKYIVVQDLRTLRVRNELKEVLTSLYDYITYDFLKHKYPDLADNFKMEIKEDFFKRFQIENMVQEADKISNVISRYKWVLYKNSTNQLIYTSDHPVIKENEYFREFIKDNSKAKRGFFSQGVTINFPINPQLYLTLLEPSPYPPLFFLILESNKQLLHENIDWINSSLTDQANRFVYSQDNNFELAFDILKRIPESRNEFRKRFKIDFPK
jgi:hypothetical protein